MRSYLCLCALIVLCSLIGSYSANSFFELMEQIEDQTNRRLTYKGNDGSCIFEKTVKKMTTVPVEYFEIETYWGRCRGYYFKKCQQERNVPRTRYEQKMIETNETFTDCCDGYAKTSDSGNCMPICDKSCVYGNCTEPNVCTCYSGYSTRVGQRNICDPECTGCDDGNCIAPNICYCNAGYNWDFEQKKCVPVCSGNCHNGKCIGPEQCECNEGYAHHATHSVCIPNCIEHCVFGECIETDKCECNFGLHFVNGSQHICEPFCEMSCKNAQCTEPNVCECHSGYSVLNESAPHECHCGLYCVEVDGKCHCLDENQRISGDELLFNLSSICTDKNCLNGVCLTPHDCECFDGFEKDDMQNCVAVNETCIDEPDLCNGSDSQPCNCINGVCSSNHTCYCVNGFKMSEGHSDLCEPHCTKECINGFCINPDSCECNVGYRLGYNESELHICHPVCDPDIEENNGCRNGTCIAPDTCQCYDGYELDVHNNFTCVPMPFMAKLSRYGLHWIIPLLAIILIAVSSFIAISFFGKRNPEKYNMHNGELCFLFFLFKMKRENQ